MHGSNMYKCPTLTPESNNQAFIFPLSRSFIKNFRYNHQIVGRVLSSMRSEHGVTGIEYHAEHLLKALKEALHLVESVKSYNHPVGMQR